MFEFSRKKCTGANVFILARKFKYELMDFAGIPTLDHSTLESVQFLYENDHFNQAQAEFKKVLNGQSKQAQAEFKKVLNGQSKHAAQKKKKEKRSVCTMHSGSGLVHTLQKMDHLVPAFPFFYN